MNIDLILFAYVRARLKAVTGVHGYVRSRSLGDFVYFYCASFQLPNP